MKETPLDSSRLALSDTYLTYEAAERARDNYLRSYHPWGYGTAFGPITCVQGYYVLKGTRRANCDD